MSSGPGPATYAIANGVLTRRVEGEMVLLDMNGEQYYGLDAVGADIVSRITSQPLEDAIGDLVRDYDVDPAMLRADVDRLVGELCEAGLLHVARDSP